MGGLTWGWLIGIESKG